MEFFDAIDKITAEGTVKITISKPKNNAEYRKISIVKTEKGYYAEQFTKKQAFRKNLTESELNGYIKSIAENYMQINAWSACREHIVLVSKKGKVTYKSKRLETELDVKEHNRKKRYLIPEGKAVMPLVDMGIFTADGKVVKSMYDKFRQINRFLELINDEIKKRNYEEIKIIDFGCGKSYLTFVVYYYLTEIMGIRADVVGLDLKAEVINNCSEAAKRYGYEGLRFEVGDINGYECTEKPDMVITLHACDTATDYALYNAVKWDADLIFSVPCCQHELNSQMKSEALSVLTRYGIVKERTAALMTDAIRANLLWYKGYNTQLLEFVDMSHTPKNILIRAVKTSVPQKARKKYLEEVKMLNSEFSFAPTLYGLIMSDEDPVGKT